MPEDTTKPEYTPTDHPWIEMPMDDDSLDETVRFSLDEIRIAKIVGAGEYLPGVAAYHIILFRS